MYACKRDNMRYYLDTMGNTEKPSAFAPTLPKIDELDEFAAAQDRPAAT